MPTCGKLLHSHEWEADEVFAVYAFLSVVNLIIGLEQDSIIDGKYGTQLSPLFLVHMLYVVVSVWACFRVFSQSSTRQARPMSIHEAQRTTLVERPLDFLFVIYLVPATFFCVFRGLVALDCPTEWCQEYTQQYEPYLKDPSSYPKIQAQFSHIGASFHTRTPFSYRVPADSQIVFLLVNALYAIVPQALCYRCVTSPAFFLRDQPNDKKTD
ncbi:unnamed protein product [Coregonus sp. 'balchen']|nr:unnamed protein product [Coregonus sp. 'balchen']